MKKSLLALLALLFSATLFAELTPLAPEEKYPEIARLMIRQVSAAHLSGKRFDDSLSAVAWTNHVDALDYDHTLLTQEDLARIAPMKTQLDNMLLRGDLSFGYDLMNLVRERLLARCDYVDEMLAKEEPFDFSTKETFVWKRRKAERPATYSEQRALWHDSLKNEYLALKLTKELDAEEAAKDPKPEKEAEETSYDEDDDLNEPVPEIIRKRYQRLREAYQEMDSETVLQRYLSAVANAYDPHTDYMSPMNFEDFSMEMNLTLYGIGATLRYDDGAIRITDIMPGAPADRDTRDIRLQEGDRIIGVGQGDGPIEDIRHKPLNKTVRKIRGPKGTKVVLKVIPVSDKTGTRTKIVDLIRDEIRLEEQAVTGRVERITAPITGEERRLGYVRIPAFYAGTVSGDRGKKETSMSRDLLTYLQQFNAEHVDGLVIDLRNNGGGSLLEALNMNGFFVDGPVVQVKDRNGVQSLVADSHVAFRKPIVVLVNRTSASASEIVASALQDYGRAIVVGDSKTHGKGTVQTVAMFRSPFGLQLPSTEYGADRITTACFYRINGGTTQLRGVVPDIVLPSIYDALETGEDQLTGALPYSTVSVAQYATTENVGAYLSALRTASAKRLAQDSQYQAAQQLIDHVRQANAEETVSLNEDLRRDRMRAERAMQKLQDEALSGSKNKKEGPTIENDPVLRESFNILSDFIDLRGGPDKAVETDGDANSRLYRIFGDL